MGGAATSAPVTFFGAELVQSCQEVFGSFKRRKFIGEGRQGRSCAPQFQGQQPFVSLS